MAQTDKNIVPFTAPGNTNEPAHEGNLKKLSALLEKFTPHDGRFDIKGYDLRIVKASKPSNIATHTLSYPGICIVAQGAKSVCLAHKDYSYDETNLVVYAAEVPISSNILKASKDEPYLCLVLQIDPKKLSELVMKVFPNGVNKTADSHAIHIGQSNPKIIKSAIRLMEIITEQENADLLAPLMIDEILIHLLRSSSGPSIAQIGIADSHAEKVARAISWIKENYAKPMKVEKLAEIAGMSPSSFHSHFRSVTSMSPLQFQKAVRLQEARNLMIAQRLSVSSAGFQVGYASVSQFSREYSRHFGKSPTKDIETART